MELHLRPVVADDLSSIFAWHHDPASIAMSGVPPRDRPAFDAHWARLMGDAETTLRAIVADGGLVGYCLSWRAEGQRYVGYWVAREQWGRGIASQAFARFVAELAERPLIAIVVKSNAPSIRVLERAGFARAGEDPRDAWRYALEG